MRRPPPHTLRAHKFWRAYGSFGTTTELIATPLKFWCGHGNVNAPMKIWRAHKFAIHWLSLSTILGSSAVVLGATVMRIKWAIFSMDSPYTDKLASLSHEKLKCTTIRQWKFWHTSTHGFIARKKSYFWLLWGTLFMMRKMNSSSSFSIMGI